MELKGFDTSDIRTIVTVFCVDDGLVAARDPKVPQDSFDILTKLFDRVSLQINTTKAGAMVSLPGRIRTRQSPSRNLGDKHADRRRHSDEEPDGISTERQTGRWADRQTGE